MPLSRMARTVIWSSEGDYLNCFSASHITGSITMVQAVQMIRVVIFSVNPCFVNITVTPTFRLIKKLFSALQDSSTSFLYHPR